MFRGGVNWDGEAGAFIDTLLFPLFILERAG
jgi:hypothetical protein